MHVKALIKRIYLISPFIKYFRRNTVKMKIYGKSNVINTKMPNYTLLSLIFKELGILLISKNARFYTMYFFLTGVATIPLLLVKIVGSTAEATFGLKTVIVLWILAKGHPLKMSILPLLNPFPL